MEPIIDPNAPQALPPTDLIKDTSEASFMQDVIEASQEVPVIVDFWAPWCGPCKQLGPMLESIVTGAKGAVRLVKIDIDQNQQIAAQLRIQSIPAVYAFYQGKPVDAFQGALPESELRAFVDKLVKTAGTAQKSPAEEALEQAASLFEAGDAAQAGALYAQIVQHDPTSLPAKVGLARCLLATDQTEQAREIVAALSDEEKTDAALLPIIAALDLADKAAAAGDLAPLRAAVEADAANHQARFDLALALYAGSEKEEAMDALVEIIRRNRGWNDDAARKQLLEFFEAMGPTDPMTVIGRRKLSTVLFS